MANMTNEAQAFEQEKAERLTATERRAIVRGKPWGKKTLAEQVGQYLPSNYRVVETLTPDSHSEKVLVAGIDKSGWTLDGYVLPRLASGLMFGKEIGI
jgi:hypothetical protein